MKQMLARPTTLKALLVTFAVLVSLLSAACGGGSPELEFAMRIEEGKLIPDSIDVHEGDKVVIKVQTDQPGEVRIGGIEVKGRVEPGQVTELRFSVFDTRFGNVASLGRNIYFTPDNEPEGQIGFVGTTYD